MQTQYTLIPYERLLSVVRRIFQSYGFGEAQSHEITDVLLRADLFGIESHGVQRLVRYHREIHDGWVDIAAEPEILYETPLSAVMDAHHAMGQLVGIQAMRLAIDKAKRTGAGFVTVRDSNHYGIAAYYTHMAVAQGLIGVCMTNTEAIMVPTFGKQAMLGTNPIALAMPADPVPFSFDAATTVVPRGKLEVYAKRGNGLPAGWVIDEDGLETQDPDLVLTNITQKLGGGILPLGGAGEETSGYKGYGFAMLCEIFTGVLAGGRTSNHVNTTPGHTNIAHGFYAIDPALFGDPDEIKARFSLFLQEMRDAGKAMGQSRIYIHGEKEFESMSIRRRDGVPVNAKTHGEIVSIARACGVLGEDEELL